MAFTANSGLIAPGHSFAVLTQRHMHLYGTKREHFAEIAISQRANRHSPSHLDRTDPITLEEYFNADDSTIRCGLFDSRWVRRRDRR